MKRFVIATASALFLLAGTATASVPSGPGTRPGHFNSFSPSANGGPEVESGVPVSSLVPWADRRLVGDAGRAGTGLPGAAAPLLGTVGPVLGTGPLLGAVDPVLGAVDPALAALAGALPPPVAGLLSPVAAAPVPSGAAVPRLSSPEQPPAESKPAASARKAATTKRQAGKAALQAAAAGDLFKGLPANGYAAYGTASVIHTDLLQVGTQRLENLDAAFSGATFSSSPITEIKNEMARIVAPALGAGSGFGRGSGLEVGLGIDQSAPNQIVPGSVAEAKSPPSTQLVTTEVGPVNVDPLVSATLLRGQAQSLANAICTPGVDLSYGLGYAANLGLLSAAAVGSPVVSSTAETPERSVQQSRSRTFLVEQQNPSEGGVKKFGIASETRQTIAPITFFKGTPNQFTLEFAGEWVLRTVADGKSPVKVHYGPGNVSPETPLLRILDEAGVATNIITTQQLLGAGGLTIDLPVAKISIGGPPRMIGGAASSTPIETATLSAAAVDVVSVQLLDTDGLRLADVRVGHMENAATVPEGGIECGIGLVKKSDKDAVGPGESFTWTVTVTNPNDCVLKNLKVVDTITATSGILWTVTSATPTADQMSNGGVTWNDVGPLNPGQSKDLQINVTVAPTSGGGKFLDEAVATGVCGPAEGTAGVAAGAGVPLEARVSLNLPEVNVALGALLPRELPRTGGLLAVLPALALTGAGLLLRQSKRRRGIQP